MVCDPPDAACLQRLLPASVHDLGLDHYQDPAFCQQPIVWLSSDDLRAPNAGNDEARRRWGQIIHLISRRLQVQLVRVTKGRELVARFDWQERFKNEIDPKIQSPVRGHANVLIVVFERDPQASELEELARCAKESVVYLMMPELRVEQSTPRLVHSIHVWHEGVARLLARLVEHELPEDPGIYTWRGLQIRAEESRGAVEARLKVESERFISWLCSVDPIPRPQAQADGDDNLMGRTAMGDSMAQSNPKEIAEPDTSTAEAELADFAGMESQSAEKQVEMITSPEQVEKQARAAGREWRKTQAELPARLVGVEKEQGVKWRKISSMGPPEGGPGLTNEVCLSLASQVEAAGGAKAVAAQQAKWAAEFALDNEDIGARNHKLRQKARELQRARDHLVGLAQRAALGLFCAIIVGFILVQAMESWSGIWRGGVSFGAMPTREAILLVTFAVCGTLGVAAGVVFPYWLETWRGKAGARSLRGEAVELKKRMVARLNRRLKLCHSARGLAAVFTELAVYDITRLLAGRASAVIKESFNAELAGPAGQPPDWAVSDAEHQQNFDLAAFHRLLTITVPVNLGESQAQRQDSTKPEWPEYYKTALHPWIEQMEKTDFEDSGWLPRSRVHPILSQVFSHVHEMCEQPRPPGDASCAGPEVGQETQKLIKSRLEAMNSRYSHPGEDLGMMSLHFNIEGARERPPLRILVASPHQDLRAIISDNITKVTKARPQEYSGPLLLGEDVFVEVFQELPVIFDKTALNRTGAAWFSPGTGVAREESAAGYAQDNNNG